MDTVLIIVVGALLLFELLEHLVLPLLYYRRLGRRRPLAGRRSFVGKTARVVRWSGGGGTVMVDGEYWRARSHRPLNQEQQVRITALEGLEMIVDEMGSPRQE